MGLNRGLCKWQSQEQLPLQRSCSPIAQTTVYEPGYGQLVLILKLPPSRKIRAPHRNRARGEKVPHAGCSTSQKYKRVPAAETLTVVIDGKMVALDDTDSSSFDPQTHR